MSEKKEVHVKASDESIVPKYVNRVQIAHTAEEFVLELFAMYPPQGVLIDRVVISPEHAVRLRDALDENIKRYESNYHRICEAVVPLGSEVIQTIGSEPKGDRE